MSTGMKKELSKARKILHPNSRKSIAICKKTKRILNREKVKLGSAIKQNLIGEKMLWLQEHMLPDVCPYTPELTAELLETYISRYDEELEQIGIKHSVGGKRNRQHASREDVIRMTKERDREEYNTCGIEIPDILNPIQCDMLSKWNGELRYLPNFKFRRFGKKHLSELLRSKNKSSKKAASTCKRSLEIENKSESVGAETIEEETHCPSNEPLMDVE